LTSFQHISDEDAGEDAGNYTPVEAAPERTAVTGLCDRYAAERQRVVDVSNHSNPLTA
jgi:hypothetical protein